MYLRNLCVGGSVYGIFDYYKEHLHGRFQHHTCCISDNLINNIRRQVWTHSIAKINIGLMTKYDTIKTESHEWDGVINLETYFDFDSYILLEQDVDKKRMIAYAVRDRLHQLFEERQWNFDPISKAIQKMEEENFIFEGILEKSWANPNNLYRTRLWFSYGLESVQFAAILYKNQSKQEICRRNLATIRPAEGCRYAYAENVCWISETILESRTPDFAERVAQVDFADAMQQ
jgi:hypothetical protein